MAIMAAAKIRNPSHTSLPPLLIVIIKTNGAATSPIKRDGLNGAMDEIETDFRAQIIIAHEHADREDEAKEEKINADGEDKRLGHRIGEPRPQGRRVRLDRIDRRDCHLAA
jgi:hypothetical protein